MLTPLGWDFPFGEFPFGEFPANSQSVASTTNANAATFVDVSIFFGELVTTQAMSLTSTIRKRANAAFDDIGSGSHRLQVVGVDAQSVSAKVVQDKPFRDCALHDHVSDSMRRRVPSVPMAMPVVVNRVSTTAASPLPYPARISFLDFAPESSDDLFSSFWFANEYAFWHDSLISHGRYR